MQVRRLNIWDFDDTLVWSKREVDRYLSEHPDVPPWKCWHDADISSDIALQSLPILPMWDLLMQTSGDHWILSGRVLDAIEIWLSLWQGHPRLGKVVDKISRVQSTSLETEEPGGSLTHLRKRAFVLSETSAYDTVHIYDDYDKNLQAVSDLPKVTTHHVVSGRVAVKSSRKASKASLTQRIAKSLQDMPVEVQADVESVVDAIRKHGYCEVPVMSGELTSPIESGGVRITPTSQETVVVEIQ